MQVRKYRQVEQCFLVQGAKAVKETLDSDFETRTLVGTSEFFASLGKTVLSTIEMIEVSEDDLSALGSVESNNSALAIINMGPNKIVSLPKNDFTLALDDIRDPGNLGTIIRTADWYGIKNIVASPETTDLYNPKVINASMGSFLRVNVFYTPLEDFLSTNSMPTYGTFLKGGSIHSTIFAKEGLIVIGNESKGISPTIEKKITHRLTIPRFGGAESLNAATATGIVLDNLRKQL